ncbi:hypothetical protein V498_02198 [Pseudogymnoascus sp. VKM F-4517 (FW-2822)]|nr:hypothetical protein V498_02198 [Pseudogymnoascus sp. VKM F-4517 (FW-2822)]
MASALAKFLTAILSRRRRHRKIAIIGLDDASGIDLLRCFCSTIKEKKGERRGCLVYTGTSSSLKCDFDFVVVEFRDADGFIWVVDGTKPDLLVEAREEMGRARKGGGPGQGLEQAGVSPEAPWLVLVDFKQNPLSIAEAARQAELVVVAAGDDLDWTSRAVSTTTCEGLSEAIGWLYKKVK